MKKYRIMALGIVTALVLTATPVYATPSLITLLPDLAERVPEEDAQVLTLEEAFNLARRNNSSIDALNDSVRFIEQQRRSLSIEESNLWRFGFGNMDQSAENARRAIRSIDQTIGNLPANIQIMESVSDSLVLSSVNSIRVQEINVIVLQETVALQSVALDHAELRNSLGLESDADLSSARQDLQQRRASLRALEIGLNSQRSSLNHLLGLPSGTDVHVQHELQFEVGNISVSVDNIDFHIDRQIATDPSIAVLRRQLQIAQTNYDSTENWRQNRQLDQTFVNLEANATDRATMLNALENASRELRTATDNMRENIRQAYNNLRQLEEQREMLIIDIRSARDTYDNAVVNLAAGMVTEHEVNAARLAILSAEASLIANVISHENLIFAFDSPVLLNR